MHCANLTINNLRVPVFLGVPNDERASLQDVLVSVRINYKKVPIACESDDIADSFCYDNICSQIKQLCKDKQFKLVEHLCFLIYGEVKKIVGTKALLSIKLHKCNPPIDSLEGGVDFEYGDI